MSVMRTIKTISVWIAAHAGIHQSKMFLTSTTRWSERELTPSRLAKCSAWKKNSHPLASRPQVDPKFLDHERPQVCDRKLASIQTLRYCMRPQVYIQTQAASPSTHAQPRTGTQGERAWVRGEEGSNPPVHREKEGEGAILPPYMHPIPPLL